MKHIHHLLKQEYHSSLIEFLKANAGKMGRSLVTIGWDDDKPSRQWIDFFRDDLGFEKVLIIEAYQANANAAMRCYKDQPQVSVIWNSIQNAVDDSAIWETGYDACIHSHGPEHIDSDELAIILPKLFDRLRMLFIGWCPYGNYYGEDALNRNPWQRHRIISPTPELFQSLNLGLTTFTCDKKDGPNGLVVLYKWLQGNKNET